MKRFALPILLLAVTALPFAGCAKRERLTDVRTPVGGATVDKVTTPDGESHVDVNVDVGPKQP